MYELCKRQYEWCFKGWVTYLVIGFVLSVVVVCLFIVRHSEIYVYMLIVLVLAELVGFVGLTFCRLDYKTCIYHEQVTEEIKRMEEEWRF